MKDFLAQLGINLPGEENEDMRYVINIPDSNEYGKVFSKLDNNSSILEIPNEDDTFNFDKISYESEDYYIDLYSNYDEDEYRLECYKKDNDII